MRIWFSIACALQEWGLPLCVKDLVHDPSRLLDRMRGGSPLGLLVVEEEDRHLLLV